MAGNPLARLLAVAGLLVLAGLIVGQVTGVARGGRLVRGPEALPAPIPQEHKLEIVLRFVPPPETFSIEHLGKVLVEGKAGMDEVRPEERFAFAFPMTSAGIDLVLRVQWPQAVPYGACRLVAAVDGTVRADQTAWGGNGATMEEVITVKE
jgi:hypothetical protein